MIRPRRLPSLDGLRAFEVAARHQSFTAAAAELFVTQGAVSQRIKALEQELGTPLFDRAARGLVLTPTGERLAENIRAGLSRIADALAGFDLAEDSTAPFVLSVMPSVAARWFVPRLSRLTALHPALHVQIIAERAFPDFADRTVHAALRFGPPPPPELLALKLMNDTVAPVCAPALLAGYGDVRTPEALARMPILHDSHTEDRRSGSDWRSWLDHVGAAHIQLPAGQRFSQAGLTIDAAVSGLGVTLARATLIDADLDTGRLVALPLPAMATRWSYWLIGLPEIARDQRFVQLRDWLMEETRALPEPGWAGISSASPKPGPNDASLAQPYPHA